MSDQNRSAASCARLLGIGLSLTLLGGCGEPSANVLAMWVDATPNDDGRRMVRLYEGGERDSIPIAPDIPGAGPELLTAGVDRRGRGVVLSAIDSTYWVERGSARQVRLTGEAVGRPGALTDTVMLTASGDAILRRLHGDDDTGLAWAMASLSGIQNGTPWLLTPPDLVATDRRWSLLSAADAPVMVFAEVGGSPAAVAGRVFAYAYPSEIGEGPRVDEWRPLGQGTMTGRGRSVDVINYLEPPACKDRLCMSPSGRQLVAMADTGECQLLRWSWTDALVTGEVTPPELVSVACPAGESVGLVAVLDDDLVVLDDPHRVYLADLTTGDLQAIPKPQGINTAHLVDDGHGLLITSSRGEVARVDAAGPRMIGGAQTLCTLHSGIAVSPSGNWVVRTCNGQPGLPDGVDGQVQRVSVLGIELYSGIPLRPIAIDDDGNALLYSVASSDDDGKPRGLFVLSGDGLVSRVDPLEPTPHRLGVLVGDRLISQYFAATSPQ